MQKIFRSLASALVFAAGCIAGLGAVIFGSLTVAIGSTWFERYRFAPDDLHTLRIGLEGFCSSAIALLLALYARRKLNPSALKLVTSRSGRAERYLARGAVLLLQIELAFHTFAVVSGSSERKLLWTLVAMFLFWLGLHVVILIHELGHAFAALLLGWQVHKVQIGFGPLLLRKESRNGFIGEWRLFSDGGLTIAWPQFAFNSRWRRWLYVAGGPAASFILVGIIGSYLYQINLATHGLHQFSGVLLAAICVFGALVAFGNLVPYRTSLNEMRPYSDGYHLLAIPFRARKELQEASFEFSLARLAHYWSNHQDDLAWKEMDDALSRYPDKEAQLQFQKGQFHLDEGNFSAAIGAFEMTLAAKGLPSDLQLPAKARVAYGFAAIGDPLKALPMLQAVLADAPIDLRPIILDEFASIPIVSGKPILLPEALAWCTEAMQLAPHVFRFQLTNAAVLFEQNRDREAEGTLRKLVRTDLSDAERGVAAFYLALILRRRGKSEAEVKRWRAKARRWSPLRWISRRIEAELQDLPVRGEEGITPALCE